MALTGSSNANSNGNKKLYVGLECFKVLTLNPSKAEMKEILNIEVENEPVYTKEDNGETSTRLDFWLDNGLEGDLNIRTKMTFFVSNKKRVNKTGDKYQLINQYGTTIWLSVSDFETNTIPENQQWFPTAGIRRAYTGEDDLMSFLANFLNISVKKGDTCALDNIEDLVENGDVEEIRGALEAFEDNEIKVLLGVKDNKYQVVYTKQTMRPYASDFKYITRALEGYKPESVFYPDAPYMLKEYNALNPDKPDTENDLPFDTTNNVADWGSGLN